MQIRPIRLYPEEVSNELLSTNEAAALLKVGTSSIKRWADEGRLPCVKTAGGHRRFRRSDVERIQNRGAENFTELDTRQVLQDREGHKTVAQLYQLRSRCGSWYSVAEEVGKFLGLVGAEWANGILSLVEEHRISESLARAIHTVCQSLPLGANAPVCMLVVAEGDEHTLGLRLAELVAREGGWQSMWIGPNTPLSELGPIVERGGVDALAVSASEYSSNAKAMGKQVSQLVKIARKSSVSIALGGTGAWPDDDKHVNRVRTFSEFRAFLDSVHKLQ